MIKNSKVFRYSLFFTLLFIIISYTSSLLIKNNITSWYSLLIKPPYNPPSWVFGPVWTLLYTFMGIICGILLNNHKNYKKEFNLFMLQYLCNIIWTPLFFYYHRVDLALLDILLLSILLTTFIILMRKNRAVLFLSLPYLLWVLFASFLNFKIYILN